MKQAVIAFNFLALCFTLFHGFRIMPVFHLFIDTNVLLNFYSFADDDLDQLEELIGEIREDGVCLHLPEQVVNELARNREAKLKFASEQFNKEPLPSAVPRHMQAYPQHQQYVVAIEQAKNLRKQLISLALADASNQTLKTDTLLRELFAKATRYSEDNEIFVLATQRAQKGNPPGKVGSFGDQYNWEVLLHHVPDADLHIVSRDGDYASLLNKSRPHPSLENEWMDKKTSRLHIYPELRSFLRRYRETVAQTNSASPASVAPAPVAPTPPTPTPETLVVVPAPTTPPTPNAQPATALPGPKQVAIHRLVNSENFASTHSAIAALEPFSAQLDGSDAECLIEAAVSNNQIRWIASDSDVYAFFASLITTHTGIPNALFEEAVNVFGLRPEPDDPFDH